MIDTSNKYCVALKNHVSPIMVKRLGTDESKKVMDYFKSHTYWFSEMYAFVPSLRAPLRAVLDQLGIKP